MKLSEFTLTHNVNNGPGSGSFSSTDFAEVTVTTQTGWLWWEKTHTERKKIFRDYGDYWRFCDGGGFTPGFQAEELAAAWRACAKLLAK